MAQNKNKATQKRAIRALTSIGGYMITSILIGIYLDQTFFHNGISVIVMLGLGIIGSFSHILRLVMISNDHKEN